MSAGPRASASAAVCVDGRTWLTGQAVEAAARDLTAELLPGAGAAPQGAVLVPARAPLATLETLLAVLTAGAVPVVVDPDLDDDTAGRLVELAGSLGGATDGDRAGAAGVRAGSTDAEPRLVLQTGGSTARPRAVLRTVASWDRSLAAFSAAAEIRATDVVWAPGGLSSTLTLFAVWHAYRTGLRVLASGRWRGVAAAGPAVEQVTVLHCVPAILADVLDAHAAGTLPRLRTAVVAGAATSTGVRERAGRQGLRLVEYYGAAELSFVAIDDDGGGLRAFPGVQVAVRQGQIWVRSPYLSAGYLDPTASGPLLRDPDGWHTVGDRGRLIDGRLTVHGRGGDTVTVGGHTVAASEVEAALADVPGVLEVACVGEPHGRLGERVVLAVRAQTGVDPVPALRAAARRALAPPARPVRYVVVAELPRTAGGKVSRATLRELVTRAGRASRRAGAHRTAGA